MIQRQDKVLALLQSSTSDTKQHTQIDEPSPLHTTVCISKDEC